MEAIKLGKNQEIQSIRLEPADNGGVILSYEIYSPAATHMESTWDNKKEIYKEDEIETIVFPRILELYKDSYNNKKPS